MVTGWRREDRDERVWERESEDAIFATLKREKQSSKLCVF